MRFRYVTLPPEGVVIRAIADNSRRACVVHAVHRGGRPAREGVMQSTIDETIERESPALRSNSAPASSKRRAFESTSMSSAMFDRVSSWAIGFIDYGST